MSKGLYAGCKGCDDVNVRRYLKEKSDEILPKVKVVQISNNIQSELVADLKFDGALTVTVIGLAYVWNLNSLYSRVGFILDHRLQISTSIWLE